MAAASPMTGSISLTKADQATSQADHLIASNNQLAATLWREQGGMSGSILVG
jgi:hypothetical protein